MRKIWGRATPGATVINFLFGVTDALAKSAKMFIPGKYIPPWQKFQVKIGLEPLTLRWWIECSSTALIPLANSSLVMSKLIFQAINELKRNEKRKN